MDLTLRTRGPGVNRIVTGGGPDRQDPRGERRTGPFPVRQSSGLCQPSSFSTMCSTISRVTPGVIVTGTVSSPDAARLASTVTTLAC